MAFERPVVLRFIVAIYVSYFGLFFVVFFSVAILYKRHLFNSKQINQAYIKWAARNRTRIWENIKLVFAEITLKWMNIAWEIKLCAAQKKKTIDKICTVDFFFAAFFCVSLVKTWFRSERQTSLILCHDSISTSVQLIGLKTNGSGANDWCDMEIYLNQ